MKLILVNGEDFRLNLRKSIPNLQKILREQGIDEDVVNNIEEIKDKMLCINSFLPLIIKDVAQENAENSIATRNGIPTKERELKEVDELDKVGIIECDISQAIDEFNLLYKNGECLPNSCFHLEVVTHKVAEENDREWLRDTVNYTDEDRKSYKLGEVMSDYTILTYKYCFKFM